MERAFTKITSLILVMMILMSSLSTTIVYAADEIKGTDEEIVQNTDSLDETSDGNQEDENVPEDPDDKEDKDDTIDNDDTDNNESSSDESNQENNSNRNESASTKTGDVIWIYIADIAIAGIILVVSIKSKKRRR